MSAWRPARTSPSLPRSWRGISPATRRASAPSRPAAAFPRRGIQTAFRVHLVAHHGVLTLRKLGIKKRVTTHGLRRTLNNLSRQVAGEIVTRSITGHVTQATTEHCSHVDRREKLAAANSIVQLPGLRKALTSSNGEFGGENTATKPRDTKSNEPNLLN